MIELTDEQSALKEELIKFYRSYRISRKKYFSYSGAAGTGKTTVMREMAKALGLSMEEVMCIAYVGKAVMVLSMNGLNSSTIHSFIYEPTISLVLDDDGDPIKDDNGGFKKHLEFKLKDHINPKIKLIFCDEASMVNDSMIEDILSFGVPVVFAGDMNQLPPVFGVSSVMLNPDFILTKIMRQAEGNPIIDFSQRVLNNKELIPGRYGDSNILEELEFDKHILTDYDVIICNKKSTREAINTFIRRELLNIPNNKPRIGEKIICRQNNWNRSLDGFFLVNGMTGIITDVNYSEFNGKKLDINFKPDFTDNEFEDIYIDYKYITASLKEREEYGMTRFNKFEYAYAINTHISQGSQYNRVLYIDEPFWNKDTTKKIRYTAITRAIDKIDILLR